MEPALAPTARAHTARCLGHRRQAAAHLVSLVHKRLVSSLIESRKSQLALRFIQLLGNTAAQVVQLPVKLANLLLVVDSLQGSRSDRTIEPTGAIQNVGDLIAQALAGANR